MSGHKILENLRQAEFSYTDGIKTAPLTVDSGAPGANTPGYVYIRTDGTDADTRLYMRGDTTTNSWQTGDTFIMTGFFATEAANQIIGLIPVECECINISYAYTAADGSACNVQVKAAADGQGTGGTSRALHTGNLDGNTDVNTVQSATLNTSNTTMAAGDLVFATVDSTDGSLANQTFTLLFRAL